MGSEAAGEDLAVVGEQLLGHAMAGQGGGEHLADRPGGGMGNHPSSHAEPGMIIQASDQLGFTAIDQP